MTRPTVAPDWATNANYGAGGRPWNGQPNKTQPSAGVIAEGFDPENPLAADFLNWVLNNHGSWLSYHDTLLGLGVFGSGFDGAGALDGINTYSWAVYSSGEYSLLQDVNLTDLTLNKNLNTNGYRIYGTGVCTTNGFKVKCNGSPGQDDNIGSSGGASAPSATVLGSGAGGNSTTTNGSNGSSATNGIGGAGGNGGDGSGGTHGNGAAAAAPGTFRGSSATSFGQWMGHALGIVTSASTPVAFGGGGGGGGGGGTGSVAGAGGGSGGGLCMVAFRSVVMTNADDIQALGGAGGAATVSTHGAGGGGGGGYVRLVCGDLSITSGSMSAAVNCAGGAAGINGGNAARDGVAGSNGHLEVVNFGTLAPLATGTRHVEEGFISVNSGDTLKTATFNVPFTTAPPTAGGYVFTYSIMRTDGVIALPATIPSAPAIDHVDINIIDPFQGVICWRASVNE